MPLVLVTGAAGFLGRHIVREMIRGGWDVLAVDAVSPENATMPRGVIYRSLQLPDESFPGLLKEFRPSACLHAAGRASVAASVADPDADFASSVGVTQALLSALRDFAPGCRTVLLSSAAVYGQPEELPIQESAPVQPISPYGYHKRACEVLMEQAARLFDVPAASARIFSAYGPGLRRQVLWEIASQYAEKNCAALKGTGRESRDFIHATDAARALRLIVEKAPCTGEAYNVAGGVETTVSEAAGTIRSFFPGASAPKFEGRKTAGDPERWVADCSLIEKLGFHPSLTLEQGVEGLALWVKAENDGGSATDGRPRSSDRNKQS